MKGTLQEAGEGRWRLRVFVGREGGKVRDVNRNFRGTKREPPWICWRLRSHKENELCQHLGGMTRRPVTGRSGCTRSGGGRSRWGVRFRGPPAGGRLVGHQPWDAEGLDRAGGDRRRPAPGAPSATEARITKLERENAELRRANEILKTASAFFAGAELDRKLR